MMLLPKDVKKPAIRATAIKAAFEELVYLGDTFSWLVTRHLTLQGVIFDDNHYYSLEQIEKLLTDLLGDYFTPLLIERLTLTESVLGQRLQSA
jgi:hypothetical protein